MNSKILNLHFVAKILLVWATVIGGTASTLAQQGGKTITGTVVNEMNEPLLGVSILLVGTGNGTITDFDGNFSIQVPSGESELRFSYIGYVSKVVQVGTNNFLHVKMDPESLAISDVVVIGYGTQRKNDLTGSISSVSSKDFNGGLLNSPE